MATTRTKTSFQDHKSRSRRYLFGRASLAIEGQHLTREEEAVFQTIVREGYTLEQMESLLEQQFPNGKHEPVRR